MTPFAFNSPAFHHTIVILSLLFASLSLIFNVLALRRSMGIWSNVSSGGGGGRRSKEEEEELLLLL